MSPQTAGLRPLVRSYRKAAFPCERAALSKAGNGALMEEHPSVSLWRSASRGRMLQKEPEGGKLDSLLLEASPTKGTLVPSL